jgi:hypothetical protein
MRARRQGLQIRADLVGDVAARRHPVRADDAQIDETALHQMAARVVGDQRMRHAVLAELESGQRSPLVARPGLIHPHMHGHAPVMREIDRRGRGAPVDGGEPAGVAMGQHVDGAPGPRMGVLDQLEASLAESAVLRDVLIADRVGAGESRLRASLRRQRDDDRPYVLKSMAQVHGGRATGEQAGVGEFQRGFVGGLGQRDGEPVGGGRPDQRRAAHDHGLDRLHGGVERVDPAEHKFVRQARLVDGFDLSGAGAPDRTISFSVNFHSSAPPAAAI